MSSREKDTDDFDLERFVDLFDTAMSSDNPAVQRALKNLLMISAIVDGDATPEEKVKGPLRRLVNDLRNLNRRIGQLEQNQYTKNPSWTTAPGYQPYVITTAPYVTTTSSSTTTLGPTTGQMPVSKTVGINNTWSSHSEYDPDNDYDN